MAADICFIKQAKAWSARTINYNLFVNFSLPITEVRDLFNAASPTEVGQRREDMGAERHSIQGGPSGLPKLARGGVRGDG